MPENDPRLTLRLRTLSGSALGVLSVAYSFFTDRKVSGSVDRMLAELNKLLPRGYCLRRQADTDQLREGLRKLGQQSESAAQDLSLEEVRESTAPPAPVEAAALEKFQAQLKQKSDQLSRKEEQHKREMRELRSELQAASGQLRALGGSEKRLNADNVELRQQIQALQLRLQSLENSQAVEQSYEKKYAETRRELTACKEKLDECQKRLAQAAGSDETKSSGPGGLRV